MKRKYVVLGIILIAVLAIGGAVFYFFKRTEHLFGVEEGGCPRCLSHHVRRWEYGFGVADTEEVCAGGCVVFPNSPKYHCDVCSFDWGQYEED